MQELLRNLLIYGLFYEFCAFFSESCDFSWIVRSDAIWGWLCEIAPSRNIRRPVFYIKICFKTCEFLLLELLRKKPFLWVDSENYITIYNNKKIIIIKIHVL